jgi:hypothetical protein
LALKRRWLAAASANFPKKGEDASSPALKLLPAATYLTASYQIETSMYSNGLGGVCVT